MARPAGGRLRPPGWGLGVAVVDPVRHRAGRRRREPPVSSSTCTPPPTASWWCATTPRSTVRPTGTGHDRRSHAGRAADARQRLLVHPGGRRDARTDPRPTTRTGAGRPRTPTFASPPCARCSSGSPGSSSTSTSSRRHRWSLPTRGRWRALLAEFGRTDDVIVASFLDSATEAFARRTSHVAVSAGTVATAGFWRAVQQGDEPPALGAVALQVPERHGDLVLVDRPFVAAAHRAGLAVHVWTVNDADRHGPPGRPGGRRDHLGRPDDAGRRPGGAATWPGPGPRWRRGPDERPGQPRPQLGFLPWLAFFLARFLRLTVRFDMGGGCYRQLAVSSVGLVERPGEGRRAERPGQGRAHRPLPVG